MRWDLHLTLLGNGIFVENNHEEREKEFLNNKV